MRNQLKAGPQKRALVLEDDVALRSVLKSILLSVSPELETDWVSSAEEALPKIKGDMLSQKKAYDLIIADIFLEGPITGIDFWQTCRILCPNASVLLMSSMSEDYFLKAVGSEQVSPPFINKPFHLGRCREMIAGLLT